MPMGGAISPPPPPPPWLRYWMKLDHYFCHLRKSSEDPSLQKKDLHGKFEEFLSPKASADQKKSLKIIQRSDAEHNQVIGGGGGGADHSQIIGGMQANFWGDAVKFLGGYIPHPNRVSAPLPVPVVIRSLP